MFLLMLLPERLTARNAGLEETFSSISVEDARSVASGLLTGQTILDFCEAAINSGRRELVDICWEFPATSGMLFTEIIPKLPGSQQDELIVMMLQNERKHWVPDASQDIYSMDSPAFRRKIAAEVWIPVFRKYLPELPMDYSVMDTREKRLLIASKYAKIAGIPFDEPIEARRVWPPKRQQRMTQTDLQSSQGGRNTEPNSGFRIDAMQRQKASSLTRTGVIFIGVAIGFVVIAIWIYLRRNKGK